MDIYKPLGVRTVINALGSYTRVGGSLMAPAVLQAMAEASKYFVDMDELLARAGERIAELAQVEAAFLTSGAAAGLAIAAAACMAGNDPVKAKQLPDTSGLRNEVVMLHCHRIHYDQAIRLAGAQIVEVGFADWSDLEDLRAGITARTAALLYTGKAETVVGSVPLEQVVRIARQAGIPVIVDAADELPPVSNLHKFNDRGADLVVFSGGKDLRGPQSSGLVLGRKDLIQACAVHGSPNYGVGRPMKIGKEEIVGLVEALELYVNQDPDARLERWRAQKDYLAQALMSIPFVDVKSPDLLPGHPGSFRLPALQIEWDEGKLGMTPDQVVEQMLRGDPGIIVGRAPGGIVLRMQMLEEGEEAIIADRLTDMLRPSPSVSRSA